MKIIAKPFKDLSVDELYACLQARFDVFVIEQHCEYPDMDDMDKCAYHIYELDENDKLVAYCRVIPAGMNGHDVVSIGRVLTTVRGKGYGRDVMETAMKVAKTEFDASEVELNGQVQAKGFYESLGFVQTSDEFIEADIVHVRMWRKI